MGSDEFELDKPLIIFGRDVRKIPCFRGSVLYGIGSGLAGGLVVFMFTSKPRLACHCMVGTFGSVTLSYWMVCRHRWAYEKFSMGQIHGAVQRANLPNDKESEKKAKDIEIVSV